MDVVCGIYCIENMISNKKYIGQSIDIYERWKDHKRKLNNDKHRNRYLQRAWNKHKECNFKFYILKQCDVELLDKWEVYYIDLFDCNNSLYGYNIESGGNLNKKIAKETKDKMSQSAKGRYCGGDNPRARPVYCPQLNQTFRCIEDVERTGIVCASSVRLYLRGKVKYAGRHPITGEFLTWQDAPIEKAICEKKNQDNKYGSIYCIELDRVFEGGPSQADREGVASRTCVARCLKGERASAGKHPITGEKLHWKQIKNNNI